MSDLDAATLDPIGRGASIAQSIRTILTTAKGTRVMRRDFGSDLPLLLDRPMNEATIVSVFSESAGAIATHEPRFALASITNDQVGADGIFAFTARGVDRADGAKIEAST